MSSSLLKSPALGPQQVLPLAGMVGLSWHLLLYSQSPGLGLLLFTLLLLPVRGWLRRSWSLLDCLPLVAALGACFSGAPIMWLLWLASWALVLGKSLLRTGLPTHLYAAGGFLHGVTVGREAFVMFSKRGSATRKSRGTLGWLKAAGIPLVVTMVFLMLYLAASPAFRSIGENLGKWVTNALKDWNPLTLVSLLVGTLFGLWLMLQPSNWPAAWSFDGHQHTLLRQRKPPGQWSLNLRGEYRAGYLTLLLVNVLLALYHLVDLPWIMFQFDPVANTSVMSQLVHEGTYLLIASILLSMGIMLWIFRGNLNFFSKAQGLRVLSYLWIFQNGLLSLSVALRNLHYIGFDGLTYKRIGVMVFLLLCLFGLLSLAWKIYSKHSVSTLIGQNVAFALALALILCPAPWTRYITNFNIQHYHETGRFDWEYMLQLDNNHLDLLHDFAHVSPPKGHLQYALRQKSLRWQEAREKQGWRSWNWANHSLNQSLSYYSIDSQPFESMCEPDHTVSPSN